MSLKEKWRFAIKCMKYCHNLKINLICMGIMLMVALMYIIMDISRGVGFYMILVLTMYPAQFLYTVCGSQLVQSSPYKKALMTSLPVMTTLCGSAAVYLLMAAVDAVQIMMKPESAVQYIFEILIGGIVILVMNVYVGLVFKYFLASMILLCVSLVGFFRNLRIIGPHISHIALAVSRCPLSAAIAAGLCLTLLGSLLQYGISLLVYKKPISKRAIYGLLRQQT